MSRRAKDDFLRHYTVSDPRTHPKGYTEYKVTAQFISKRDPEDVKEVVVWKRYSDFRKLHGDLAYTHRNLFRRLEEFPAFPRAQVFGEGIGPSGPRAGRSWAQATSAGGGRSDRAGHSLRDIPRLGGPWGGLEAQRSPALVCQPLCIPASSAPCSRCSH
uniref:Sorting nexin 15 n=1 Tax=Pipistrellus kuhlii TaxID=59472 RepID=A0A7J7R113_PIPKU|nr:sorting nexin 15 [Pipistrellus kuhlii]